MIHPGGETEDREGLSEHDRHPRQPPYAAASADAAARAGARANTVIHAGAETATRIGGKASSGNAGWGGLTKELGDEQVEDVKTQRAVAGAARDPARAAAGHGKAP